MALIRIFGGKSGAAMVAPATPLPTAMDSEEGYKYNNALLIYDGDFPCTFQSETSLCVQCLLAHDQWHYYDRLTLGYIHQGTPVDINFHLSFYSTRLIKFNSGN